MSGGGTQQSLRKALGALKDTTKVGLAKVNSEYKDLDIAIVKATNHVERPTKEKHIRTIFAATSAARPRADVAYCIHALARRLAKTHNWAVALKTLIVIHRALREVDPTFREELINYSRSRGHMLNLSHFKDDSSPNAWDYSAWVRTYALFLEERLECFRVLKYDVETERSRTRELDTVELLEQLPALQQFLFHLMGCQPEGAAISNYVIQYALTLVSGESVKLYNAINDGTINLVDKFFEMQRHDAIKALEIYRRAGQQTERLSEFYEVCKGLDLGRGSKFPTLEQPPASFLSAMEEYVKDAPRASSVRRESNSDDRGSVPRVLALEYKKKSEPQDVPPSPPPPPPPEPVQKDSAAPVHVTTDLLGLDDINPDPSALEEKNALALAIVPTDTTSNGTQNSGQNLSNGTTGWELALVTPSSSNGTAQVESKLAGGFDKLTLDSLYEDAMTRQTNPTGSYHMGQVAPNPFEAAQMMLPGHDPFYASNKIAPPSAVQMSSMAQQQQAFMAQQQMMGQQAPNPFGNPYGVMYPYAAGNPYQVQNPYGNTGYM
eukprot:Gb_24032 [translate_table: standard]